MSEPPKGLSNVFRTDPLKAPEDGTIFRVEAKLCYPPARSGLSKVQNWEVFDGLVVSLHLGSAVTEANATGSGVLVAPGVAMAAKHVVEAELQDLQSGQKMLFCSAVSEQGLVLWRCRSLTIAPATDICLLGLELASELPPNDSFKQAHLTTGLPRIGGQVMIAGFRSEFSRPLDDSTGTLVGGGIHVALGKVTNRFPLRRDSAVLPWPVFEIECASLGGMSGGPIFDEEGMLVGVLSSSISAVDDLGPSYGSLLWPALHVTAHPNWPPRFHRAPASLVEMAAAGICFIRRPDAVSLSSDGIEYSPWE